jgi:predicted  nucleic acid-binding Zn-ribbon protein
MVKYCTECGSELEEDYKFCPDCGKEKATSKKGKKAEKVKITTKEEEKVETKAKKEEDKEPLKAKEELEPEKEKKKERFQLKFPKISFKKVPKKTAIFLIAIICIIVVVSGSAYVVLNGNFLNASVKPEGGRTFSITVTNDFNKDASCKLLIDHLPQGPYGLVGFTINASGSEVIEINEDDLSYIRDSYLIELIVEINGADGYPERDEAPAVNTTADFLIDMVDGQIYDFYVECTSYT